MRCQKIKRNIEEFMDGTLSEKKRVWFHDHLQNCPTCKKYFMERQQMGMMISESMKKMAGNLEIRPTIKKAIFNHSDKAMGSSVRPLILRPRFAVYAIVPLLVLGLFLIFIQSKNGQSPQSDSIRAMGVSYLELTTTHYQGASPDEWTVKRTHIERRNGGEGFLTLEIIRDLKEK